MKTYKLRVTDSLFFVEPGGEGSGWSKATHTVNDQGLVEVNDHAVVATNSFMVAEMVLTRFKQTVFLVEEDDHDGLLGAAITPELNRQLRYVYQAFRLTGKLDVKIPPIMNKFYLDASRVRGGFGYVLLEEVETLCKDAQFVRYFYDGQDGSKKAVITSSNENCLVFAHTQVEVDEIPSIFFLVHKDNLVVRISRNMYPTCFEKMPPEVQSISVKYGRPTIKYIGLPAIYIQKYDNFGDEIGEFETVYFPEGGHHCPKTLMQALGLEQM